ncbi:MAG: hypothetical protein ABDH91_03920 [Bacteroidia bacterium]
MKRFLSLSLIILSGCKQDKPTPSPCPELDTLRATYTAYVERVMRIHCVSCHQGQNLMAGVALDSYTAVRQAAERGRWYEVMANGRMPPSGKLDECTLAALRKWIEAGYPP